MGVAQTHRLMGRLAFAQGVYIDSLDENMRALELLEGNRDPRLLGRLSIDLGNSFALLGPEVHPIAVEWYQHAIDRLSRSGDWVELSRAYHNLAVALGPTHPQDGLEYLERAREAAMHAHDAGRPAGRSSPASRCGSRSASWTRRSGTTSRRAGCWRSFPTTSGWNRPISTAGRSPNDVASGTTGSTPTRPRSSNAASSTSPPTRRRYSYRLARLRTKTRDWAGAREAFDAAERLGLIVVRPNLGPVFQELRRTLEAAGRASEEPAPATEPATSDHPPL